MTGERIKSFGEERIFALFQNISDMIAVVDEKGIVSFATPSCARTLGHPEGFLVGQTPWHMIHPDDLKVVLDHFNLAVQHPHKRIPTVFRCKRADGTWIVLEALADNLSNHPDIGKIVITFRNITERQQAEERFRGILQNMDSGYFEVDLKGSFTFFNQALVDFLGYSADEMMGMNFRVFMTPEDTVNVLQLFNQVYRSGESVKNFYWWFERKDGTKAYSVASAHLLRDASGAAVGFWGTARDVTELRQIEEALRESEETFRALAENHPDFIARFDRDYHFLYVNPAIKLRMGFSPQDVIGKRNDDLGFPHALVKIWQDAIDRVFYTGKTHRIEYPFIDGAWIDCMFTPEFDTNGCVQTVLTASRNISEYRQILKKLEDSEKRLAEIIAFLPDATAVIDCDGSVTMWNRAIEEMSGIRAADIINRDTYEPGQLFYGETRPTIAHLALEGDRNAEKRYMEFSREGERIYGISHIPDMRGKETYLWAVAAPLRDAEGRITGAIESIRDITALKKLEETLQQTLNELEIRVRERTVELEEANTALRVLLKRREEDQANLEERLQLNVNELIAPLIDAIRSCGAQDRVINYLDLLEMHLKEIASPFMYTLSSVYRHLTPKEIRVASMIRDGKNTKEMAELIGVSRLTIEKHRNNIRKKLGLVHGKANLRSVLLAIK